MPQDGAPSSTSVDVLAAQVRAGLWSIKDDETSLGDEALDALVARVTAAERLPMPQDGAPPFIDVLAAQVRDHFYPRRHMHVGGVEPGADCDLCAPHLALDALVARVTAAERRAEYWNAATKATASEYQSSRAALADARNALERMYDAANGWDMSLSSWCDGRERDQLREAMIGAREVLARLDGSGE